MTISQYSLIVATLANLALGLFVISHNPEALANRLFFVFDILLIVWLSSTLLTSLTADIARIEFLGKIAFASGFLIPISFICFFHYFPDRKNNAIGQTLSLTLLLLLGAGMSFLCLFTDAIQADIVAKNHQFVPVYGPLHFIYASLTMFFALYAMYMLIRKYVVTRQPHAKIQLRYSIIGFFIFAFAAIIMQLLFPLLYGKRPVYGFAHSMSFFMVAFISYAMIKHRFMDTFVVLRNSLIYVVLIGILSGATACSILFFHSTLGFSSGINIVISSVIIGTVLSAITMPLKKIIETVIDKHVWPGHYNYQLSLRNFSQSLSKYIDLEELANFIVDNLTSIFRINTCYVFIFDHNTTSWHVFPCQSGLTAAASTITDADQNALAACEALIKHEIGKKSAMGAPLLALMERIHAEALIPLVPHNRFLGFIALGQKMHHDLFSIQDINFLSTLGHQASVAFYNAKLYDELLKITIYNQGILHQLTSGVITIDPEGYVTTMNSMARKLFELPPHEPLRMHISDIHPDVSLLLLAALREDAARSPTEMELLRNDYAAVSLSIAATNLKDPQGQTMGALAVFADVTQIKRLQSEMRRAERLATLGTLAAGIAHEIKNPLVSMKTFFQLLPEKFDDPEFRDSFSQIAVLEVQRINDLVEQLLKLARPTRVEFVVLDLGSLVEQSIAFFRNEFTAHRIKVTRAFQPDRQLVYGDKNQLLQLFRNILLNAIQALDGVDRRRIRVGVGSKAGPGISQIERPKLPFGYAFSDRTWQIQFEDSGPGIPIETLKRAFDPFFTTKEDGYGLGLSIALNIAQDHFGSIDIQSRVGEGTLFTVELPQVRQSASSKAPRHDIRSDRIR
jgi:signal transduction histidine kinase